MTIRPAVPSDAPALAALSGELGYPSDPHAIRRRLAAMAGRDDHAAFVADEPGVILGWIHVFLRLGLESAPAAEIGGLVVGESFRRRGAGRALVEAAERWGAARGVEVLTVRCDRRRESGNLFYASLGFSTAKTQIVWRRPAVLVGTPAGAR